MLNNDDIENKSSFGMVISKRLVEINKNQTWLASECCVTKGQISHIIVGRSKPSFGVLRAMATSLDIDISDLVKALLDKS